MADETEGTDQGPAANVPVDFRPIRTQNSDSAQCGRRSISFSISSYIKLRNESA